MEIYLKEPNTNRIEKFKNEASIGASFRSWVKCTKEEIDADNLEKAKQKKAQEIKDWKVKSIGAMLEVRGDYYVKPSPTENIFLAFNSMQDGATKTWRAMNKDGEKLFSLDENGNKIEPLFLDLTKAELQSASNHYEERKTNIYFLHDTALFIVENEMSTIEEVEGFDMEKWVKINKE